MEDLIYCTILGDCNVGKTELLMNYPNRRLLIESENFNRFELNLEMDEKQYKLIVDDLKGYTSFEAIRKTFIYPNIHVFIVAYSNASEDSFNNVANYWIPEKNLNYKKVPVVLLETKSNYLQIDEIENGKINEKGKSLSGLIGASSFFEYYSASNKAKIIKIFESVAIQAIQYKQYNLRKNTSSKCSII